MSEEEKKKGGGLKVVIILLVVLLVMGGAGFMTAPAMAEIACAAVGGGVLADELAALLPALSPARPMAEMRS